MIFSIQFLGSCSLQKYRSLKMQKGKKALLSHSLWNNKSCGETAGCFSGGLKSSMKLRRSKRLSWSKCSICSRDEPAWLCISKRQGTGTQSGQSRLGSARMARCSQKHFDLEPCPWSIWKKAQSASASNSCLGRNATICLRIVLWCATGLALLVMVRFLAKTL